MLIEKKSTFLNDILFIDGLWGTGKSLLGPIVSGMTGVEKVKIEHIYEYISVLSFLKKIETEAAIWMLRSYADLSQYNNTIGREVNLRWSDDSGIGINPNKVKYIKRLFSVEGDIKVDEINRKNLALCVMSHMLMLTPELLSMAYGNRIKVIEMVRHPLYMVQHWAAYLNRFESTREFTISFYNENQKVPWFVNNVDGEYVKANPVEKAIIAICHLYPWLDKNIQTAKENEMQILVLSFEETVFDIYGVLKKLEQFTKRSHHTAINSILKNQKLPRLTISQGKGHRSYGWSKSNKSEKQLYLDNQRYIRNNCSVQIANKMMQLVEWYDDRHPSELKKYK